MKKFLKIAGIILAAIALVIIIGVIWFSQAGIPEYETEEFSYQVHINPESIERGHKMVSMLCVHCHMDSETGKLTGMRMTDIPEDFGMVYAPNITQDKDYGIGMWSDAEIVYLLRTGIKRDGVYSPIYMPKFPHMADSDMNAIIAFLRSDHEMVEAAPVADIPSEPSLLTIVLSRTAFSPLPMPEKTITIPDPSDRVEFGKYYAWNLDCWACHSADFTKLDVMNPPQSEGYFGGGNNPLNREGKVILSSNLTPHEETGIGNWTEERFIKAVRFAFMEDEPALRYPMMPYPQLTDEEAGAIYSYLMTIPPIDNDVERSEFE